MKLTEAQREFLSLLAKSSTTVTRRELPLADRKEDKVRQLCRQHGWAIWGRRQKDKRNGWRITPAGRSALQREGE